MQIHTFKDKYLKDFFVQTKQINELINWEKEIKRRNGEKFVLRDSKKTIAILGLIDSGSFFLGWALLDEKTKGYHLFFLSKQINKFLLKKKKPTVLLINESFAEAVRWARILNFKKTKRKEGIFTFFIGGGQWLQ